MKKAACTLIVCCIFGISDQAAAATRPFRMPANGLNICVAGNGTISAKVKCRRNEQKMLYSVPTPAPTATPQPVRPGIDYANCIQRTQDAAGWGSYTFNLTCAPGEYLMSWGFSSGFGDLTLREARLSGSPFPSSIQLDVAPYEYYTDRIGITVQAICCPFR